jgi:glucokinase
MHGYTSEPKQIMEQEQTGNPEKSYQDVEVSSEGYVVGVDIGGTNLRLALADMTGRVLARQASSTAESKGAAAVVKDIQHGVEELVRKANIPHSALRAIAAAAPGVTDVNTGVVIATSYLMGWRNVPLQSMLESSLGIPATVDNDVNMAAIGESWMGSGKGVRDFVFIAIGTGIGAGVVLNGRPFHGMEWAAGEIGYMLVPGVSSEPAERGAPGALESMIGGEGIRETWSRQWSHEKTSLPRELTATRIFDGAHAGDPLAQAILQQSAQMLSYAIYNISLVLNCPLFVLGGGVGTHPVFCEATQKALEKWRSRSPLQLSRSALGADAQLMGAVRAALDTALSASSVGAAV